MGFNDTNSGAASVTFLILYVIFGSLCSLAVYRKGVLTIYGVILAFSTIRIFAQISAIVFSTIGIQSSSGLSWLVAYIVLGAEGYFVLLLCLLSVLFKAEIESQGWSKFQHTRDQIERECQGDRGKEFIMKLSEFSFQYHFMLMPANALVIAGGAILAQADPSESDYGSKAQLSKILRGVGQVIFLVLNTAVIFVAYYVYKVERIRNYKVIAVMIAWVFLFVRGIYGVISVFVTSLNYADPANYTNGGMKPSFVAVEYVLGTLMELLGAAWLLSCCFVKKNNKKVFDQ